MRNKVNAAAAALTVLGLFVSAPAFAQWLKHPTPGIPRKADGKPDLEAPAPKAPDGRPDLSGIWRIDPAGYGFDITLDLKPAEILPWAAALSRERQETFGKDLPVYRCLPEPGPLKSFGVFKILQTPAAIAILPEEGTYRQIHTDGRELHENERDIQHIVVTDEDRRRNQTVVTVPIEVLSQYVGVYEVTSPIGRVITYTVTLPGEQLVAQPPTGGKYPLVPSSETTFSVAGTPVEFVKDAQGTVTHFVVRTVEGDQKALRRGGPVPQR